MLKPLLFSTIAIFCWASSHVHDLHAQGSTARSYPVLSGVGVALHARDGHIYVGKVLPGSPAEKSTFITEGSRLGSIEVNGESTSLEGKTVGEAASLIRGPVGTKLSLTVYPASQSSGIKVVLVREPIEIEGIPSTTYTSLIGKPMPDMTLTTLDGKRSSRLKDYRGKIVLLDFWASWCATCYAPVAKLQTLVAENKSWTDKVVVITATIDSDLSKAERVIAKNRWNQTLHRAVDSAELNKIGANVIPLMIIVDPDGAIAHMGGAHAIDMKKEIDFLLEQ